MSYINPSYTTRITGIISGIDTDALVQKLTYNTTSKINKVKQQKQLLEWKQADYRNIISKMRSFKDKYLSTTSASLTGKFFTLKSAVTERAEDSRYVSISVPSDCDISSISLSNISVATSAAATSKASVSQQIRIGFDSGSAPVDLTGKAMDITVGGITKTIVFSKAYGTVEELAYDMAELADTAFGTDRLSVSVVGGEIVINSDGTEVSISDSSDAFSALGMSVINDRTNRIDLSKSLSDNPFEKPIQSDNISFTINGVSFSFTKDTPVSIVLNTINGSAAGVKMSYSSLTDKFTLRSTTTGEASQISISDEEGNFLESVIGPLTEENYTQGRDASVYINGVKVTRATNSFTIDGITYTLKESTDQAVNINIISDTKMAMENIKSFIADYNELLELINTKLGEARYKDFPPLSDEERAAMTESQIEKWEEKAKSGMLRNDSTLRNIASAMRAIMYTPVSDLNDNSVNIGMTMASVGISTENYSSKGKLVIDEQKLAAALENDPEGVIRLFTQKSDKIYLPTNPSEVAVERYKESGIMYRLSDVFEDNIGTLYKTGNLLQIAGYEGTSTVSNNLINRSLASYESKLDRLYNFLKNEETRYYNQFAAMEKSLNQLNQQIQYVTGNNYK